MRENNTVICSKVSRGGKSKCSGADIKKTSILKKKKRKIHSTVLNKERSIQMANFFIIYKPV